MAACLAPFLLAEGHEVVGFDSNYFADCLFGTTPSEFEQRTGDIRDLTRDDLTGFDAVCHLAALSNDPLGNLNPQLTTEINHRASVRLAELAKQAGVGRFMFSSSCSLYGSAGNEMLTETAAFEPITAYAASKVAVEHEVARLADQSFTPVFLRNATAYGVSPRLRLDLVLNEFVACAVLDGRIVIRSDGTPWRPVVHVEDICRAFAAVLTRHAALCTMKLLMSGGPRKTIALANWPKWFVRPFPVASSNTRPAADPIAVATASIAISFHGKCRSFSRSGVCAAVLPN